MAPSSAGEVWLAMVSRGRPSRLNQQVRIVSRWSRKTLLWGRARGRARARARGPELGLGCCRHTLVLEARAMQQTAATCVEDKPAQAPSGGCFQRQSTQAVPASVGPIRRLRPRWPATPALVSTQPATSSVAASSRYTRWSRVGRWSCRRRYVAGVSVGTMVYCTRGGGGSVGGRGGRRREAEVAAHAIELAR